MYPYSWVFLFLPKRIEIPIRIKYDDIISHHHILSYFFTLKVIIYSSSSSWVSLMTSIPDF